LAARLGVADAHSPELANAEAAWADMAAHDLHSHAGRSLLTCGAHLPPETQALAAYVNERLGNTGATVSYSEPITVRAGQNGTLADLARDMAEVRSRPPSFSIAIPSTPHPASSNLSRF
jgi:hypothetical protein